MRSGFAPRRVRRLRSVWHTLLATRRGNSVTLFALSAVPVLALLSVGVDYALARVTRSKLDLAADSAAVQATGAADAMQVGIAAARARFTSQTAGEKSVEVSPLQVALSQRGGLFSATVSYNATMATTIARMVGIESLPISGQASASRSYSPPVDIELLVDMSSSMTLAASAADRARLEKLTAGFKFSGKPPAHVTKGEACGFACHWSNTTPDFYQLAEKNHITLRLDVVREAVAGLVGRITRLDADNRFQLGLYGFNGKFISLQPLTRDLGAAVKAAGLIGPSVTDCSTQCADTAFSAAVRSLAAADSVLPQPGAEAGGDAVPQRYVIIITDGVRNDPGTPPAEPGPIAPTDCNPMKTLGFSVSVLYMPYPGRMASNAYASALAESADRLVPALQACASSPSYFFAAQEPADVSAQLQSIFRLILRTSSHPTN